MSRETLEMDTYPVRGDPWLVYRCRYDRRNRSATGWSTGATAITHLEVKARNGMELMTLTLSVCLLLKSTGAKTIANLDVQARDGML